MPRERNDWRDIPGWEGAYQVTSDGQVRSLDRTIFKYGHYQRARGRVLRLRAIGSRGHYVGVVLCGNGDRINRSVHSLVAETFIGPRPDGLEIRHLNGIADDNRVENLAYGTASENMRDRVRHGTDPNASKTHCPKGHPYSGENLIHSTRSRICRTCAAAAAKAYAASRRAADPEGVRRMKAEYRARKRENRTLVDGRPTAIGSTRLTVPLEHGIWTTYSTQACRCRACGLAWREYNLGLKAR